MGVKVVGTTKFYNGEKLVGESGYNGNAFTDPHIDRNLAEEIQKYMNINNTIFTDWMDKYHIDSIVFRIT